MPAQTYLIVNDGTNQQIWVLRRDTLEVVSAFGRAGRWAGQFYGAHVLAGLAAATCSSVKPTKANAFRSSSTAGWGPPRRR